MGGNVGEDVDGCTTYSGSSVATIGSILTIGNGCSGGGSSNGFLGRGGKKGENLCCIEFCLSFIIVGW